MTCTMACSIIVMRRHPQMSALSSACIGAIISAAICWPLGTPLDVTGIQTGPARPLWPHQFGDGPGLFALGSKKLPAVETALIGALDAPMAPLWVWLAFNEEPGINTIIGGGMVFVAVIAHIVASQRRVTPAHA